MNRDRWPQIEAILAEALEREPGARAAYVDAACGADAALRAEVAGLLAADRGDTGFLEEPAAVFGARLLVDDEPGAGPGVDRIGPYRIDREVGRGGMGVVYLASRDDAEFRQQVAIKLIRRGHDPGEIERRLRHERQILASLNHPNVARLFDGGTTAGGQPYFVMEYIDGLPIDAYCREQRLPVRDRLRLFLSVCEAVTYAHQHLVVHRDIKPANILVSADGVPRLLDFGIAKVLMPDGRDLDATREGGRPMSPAYASPEQVHGHTVTTVSDVFALGDLLYLLLTGGHPFRRDGQSASELEREICEHDPPPVSEAVRGRTGAPATRAELGGGLDAVVATALRKAPERRYASVEQLAGDVRRWLTGYAVEARGDDRRYRLGRFVRRHRAAVTAGAIAIAAILAGGGLALWQAHRADVEAQRARAVGEFVQGIFLAGDPYRENPNITAVETLERAAAEARTRFAGDPETLASLDLAIGQVLVNAGRLEAGLALHEQALGIERERAGDRAPATLAAASVLLSSYYWAGKYQQGAALGEWAVPAAIQAYGDDSTDVATVRNVYGMSLLGLNRYADAQAVLERALPVMRSKSDPSLPFVLGNLAIAVSRQGDLARAASLQQESAQLLRPRGENANLATTIQNLGVYYRLAGRLTEAEAALREAVDLRARLLGASHSHTAYARALLADLLIQEGRLDEARPIIDRALTDQRLNLPPRHVELSLSLLVDGVYLTRAGKLTSGEAQLREALSIRQEVVGRDSRDAAIVWSALGENLTDQRRLDEAQPLLEHARDVLAASGPDSTVVKENERRLAFLAAARVKRRTGR